jgi:erythromycin esterase-like protein
MPSTESLPHRIAAGVHPSKRTEKDLNPIMDMIGAAPLVLIGEATHGTHEFYRRRADLTRRLIVEKGFRAVAAEADWPDAYRVNRFVRGLGADPSAGQALQNFKRFPSWMWRNVDVLEFVEWLRTHNDSQAKPEAKAGFYGLDLYSLHGSMAAVLEYLDKTDPKAAARARQRYACFEQFGEDPQTYGYAATLGLAADCESAVVSQLVDMQHRRQELLERDGFAAEDELFQAGQNALVVRNAEKYYRSMFGGRISSWNLRDTHMADTLDGLLGHLSRSGEPKVVVWAHNSHVGDARATELGQAGEINVGQLARERHPGEARLVGFSTYTGTVTAASEWGGPAERKRVRPALPESYEAVFHQTEIPEFILVTRDLEPSGPLREPRLARAIGVVYLPETERQSHYYYVSVPAQFDALIHIDVTGALESLERSAHLEAEELPETYPSGM